MPNILGIVNVTPDSFWSGSRIQDAAALKERVRNMLSQGADAIDIGGCSTRPNCEQATEEQEMERLEWGLDALREEFPDIVISVDTYRARIAERCVREWYVDIINDVYGGNRDMYNVVAQTGAGYVLTCAEKVTENVTVQTRRFFEDRVAQLEDAGVNVKDRVILDPGFGFGKTLEQNWTLLGHMEETRVQGLPILAGLSRKSMAWKLLGITPAQALPATVAMNTISLMHGADWLRVHDVLEARQTIRLVGALNENL